MHGVARRVFLVLVVVTACTTARVSADPTMPRANSADKGGGVREQVRAYRQAREREILTDFFAFLSIPNVSSDRPNIRRNAEHIVRMLGSRGIAGRLLEAEDSPPAVYAEVGAPGATKTLLLYAHYDGQPVDATEWKSPPFEPILRDGPLRTDSRDVTLPESGRTIDPEVRIYARSSSDDKAGVFGILTALDALKANGLAPSVRVRMFFDGEEEITSPHLRAILEKYASLLRSDGILFIDGPSHPSGLPVVGLGVRGLLTAELTVYGANRTLHSGHYGNWAPNPIVMLTHLIDSMRDTDGTIRIAGFSEAVRPIGESDRQLLAGLPSPDAALRRELGLATSEGNGKLLAEQILLPAINLRGISSGHVGEKAAAAIPADARASIDFRLVPDLTPDRVRAIVEEHIRKQGYYITNVDPDMSTRLTHSMIVKLVWGAGYPATRTPADAPLVRAFLRTLGEAGIAVAVAPAWGASLPTNIFADVLKAPIVFVSTVNYDNSQHAANENLRLQNLWDGIDLYATTLVQLGRAWR